MVAEIVCVVVLVVSSVCDLTIVETGVVVLQDIQSSNVMTSNKDGLHRGIYGVCRSCRRNVEKAGAIRRLTL